YIIIGEAEQTLLELVENFKQGIFEKINIPGVAFRDNGLTIKTGGRPVMNDLDSLPYPAWDLVNVDQYRDAWMQSSGYFSMNMGTTRGCPFKCNWCAKPIYGNRYNARSPQNVATELKQLQDKYHFD